MPQREGYRFNRWECVDRRTGTVIQTPTTMPNEDIYFIARWTPVNTTYAFSYYLENANDDGYTNIGTYSMTAESGSVITTLDTNTIQRGLQSLRSDYQFFTYDEEATQLANETYNANTRV